jgi:hypothetical protein
VEVHQDDEARVDNRAEARRLLAKRGLTGAVDPQRLDAALKAAAGAPVDVTADRS